jgi:hypothetical protein
MAKLQATAKRQPRKDWTPEFREMGREQVRAMLRSADWDREKKAAARIWIETADALAWNKDRGPEDTARKSLILTLRSAKWWRFTGPGIIIFMALGLLMRRMGAI